MTVTSTLAAVVVPFVLQGDVRGHIYDGQCDGQPVRSAFRGLAHTTERAHARSAPLSSHALGLTSTTGISPVVINTGDLLGPSPEGQIVVHRGGEAHDALAEAMTIRGASVFDAIVPGNFELSLEPESMKMLSEKAKIPWTVSNLATHFPSERERLIHRGALTIGLTGVFDEKLFGKLHPSVKKEDLTPAAPALEASVERLRAAGAQVVVALFHVGGSDGTNAVIRILKALKEHKPDVVFASKLGGGVELVRSAPGIPPIVSSPRKGHVSVAHVRVAKEVTLEEQRSVRVAAAEDPSLGLVRDIVCQELNITVSEGVPEIDRKRFVQLVLGMMREVASAEIAIINNGAFADEVSISGKLTRFRLQKALSVRDDLKVAEILGSQLKKQLLPIVKNPRAQVLGIKGKKVAGRLIDPVRNYRVVTVDFVAEGGDGLIKKPGKYNWKPASLGSLRDLVEVYFREHGKEVDTIKIAEPSLLSAQLNVGANLKTVNLSNNEDYEAPQLARESFLGVGAVIDLQLTADFESHVFELSERTKYGVAKTGREESDENSDVTTIELSYLLRPAGRSHPWYVPDLSAAAALETELTQPETRDYRRALLEAGVGPSFNLFGRIKLRSQLGLRRSLLADRNSADPDEVKAAETRFALLSTLELVKWSLATDAPLPLKLKGKLNHSLDFTGETKDNILKGRIDFDVPITSRIAVTAGVEIYVQHRNEEADDTERKIGVGLDTSFGIKTSGDLSTALY